MADVSLPQTAVPPEFARETIISPVDLRPLTTSELIDRGFNLYRAHFAGFLLLGLLCQSAPLLGQIIATALKLNPTWNELIDIPAPFFAKFGKFLAISFSTQAIAFYFKVVMTFYVADACLGKIPSVKESLRKSTTRLSSSIWTYLLNCLVIGLSFLFPLCVLGAICLWMVFHPHVTMFLLVVAGALGLVLLVASIAPVLIIFMRLLITIPALALEGLSGWKGIKRSASLVRYDPGLGMLYWGEMRLSFLLLPLFIIGLLILSLTSLPLTIQQAGEFLRHGFSGQIAPPPDSVMVLSQILIFMADSLVLPLYSIATTLFYYDIRIRREGFDLEFMAKQLEGNK